MCDELVVTAADWKSVLDHFASSRSERMAFGYGGESVTPAGRRNLLRELDLCRDDEYKASHGTFVSLPARSTVARLLRARNGAFLLDAHSHPFADTPMPSRTDEEGARLQLRQLRDLAPGTSLVRMIVARSGRVWASAASESGGWIPVRRIRVLGRSNWSFVTPVNTPAETRPGEDPEDGARDLRTREVLGPAGANRLRSLRVLIIGAGGVGSAVARLLAGYVNRIGLCDPDRIELHNSPRLHFYAHGDAGLYKVDVAAREILRAFPLCRVDTVPGAFPSPASIELFKQADFVFCCPDHPAVRYATASEAARHMTPLVEVGCGGKRSGGALHALGYQVRLQIPGGPCLPCNGLDLRELEDPATTTYKRSIGYLDDGSTVSGELMTLTTRAAADAVELFLRYATGYVPTVPHHLYFDALNLRVIDVSGSYAPQPGCTLCGPGALLAGAGDRAGADLQISPSPGDEHATV